MSAPDLWADLGKMTDPRSTILGRLCWVTTQTQEPAMNTLTINPAAQTVAHQLIAERVQDAETRRAVRNLRQERRAARRATCQQPVPKPLPWWAFRFLHV